MDLIPITSLVDLAQKAETNKYYKQLAVIAEKYINGERFANLLGKPVADDTFNQILVKFKTYMEWEGFKNCSDVCRRINNLRYIVSEEVVMTVETVNKKTDKYKLENNNFYYISNTMHNNS